MHEELVTRLYDEEERKKRIAQVKRKMLKIIRNLDENKQFIAKNIIEELAFQTIMCEELRSLIQINGYIEQYKNGENQQGFKKSSFVEQYQTAVKSHSMYLGQLMKIIPEMAGQDDFEEFMNSVKKTKG